ncbi:MAG: hypothetical protein QM682_09775 [Paracoccus sp. (in: a-proteobacteria)]|uniref:hypothetical protein n=1 Tax=Paracoccus sp. TaxID=267 RepID=UPI0039E2970E
MRKFFSILWRAASSPGSAAPEPAPPAAPPAKRRPAPLPPRDADGARLIRKGNYILRLAAPRNARELVISFEAADPLIDRKNPLRKGFGEEFLLRKGYAVLSVLTATPNWFRPPAILDAFKRKEVRAFMARFPVVHGYGSSMGGFGALTFAELLGISNIVALQPISTLAPDLAPWEDRFDHGRDNYDWDGAYRDGALGITGVRSIYALYDPASPDAPHVARIAMAAGDRLHRITVPGAGHAVPRHLQSRRLLGPALLACLRQAPPEEVARIVAGAYLPLKR